MRSFFYSHDPVYAPHSDELITKQSHKDECDIYTILSQYQRTGQISHINTQQPKFQDLPDAIDFQQALEILDTAENAFAALPSQIRDQFQNNPENLLRAIADPAQRDNLIELGIINRPPAPRPPDPGPPANTAE